jgi:hypothetical protein
MISFTCESTLVVVRLAVSWTADLKSGSMPRLIVDVADIFRASIERSSTGRDDVEEIMPVSRGPRHAPDTRELATVWLNGNNWKGLDRVSAAHSRIYARNVQCGTRAGLEIAQQQSRGACKIAYLEARRSRLRAELHGRPLDSRYHSLRRLSPSVPKVGRCSEARMGARPLRGKSCRSDCVSTWQRSWARSRRRHRVRLLRSSPARQ